MTQATQPWYTQDLSMPSPSEAGAAYLFSINPKFPHIDLSPTKETLIGRKEQCSVRFTQMEISGEHCAIMMAPNGAGFLLKDLSTNGTFINGECVGKGNLRLLKNGDQVSLVTNRIKTAGFGSYVFKDLSERYEPESNDEIFKYFDLQHELGKGTFSIVRYAIHKPSGTPCAVKVMNKRKILADAKTREQLKQEVEILQRLDHPNIVKYRGVFEGDRYIYLVLEYVAGGELFNHIVDENDELVSEETVQCWFRQLLDAVAYLHSKSVVHRDIKPENILEDGNGNVKLTDFGLAKITGHNDLKTLCGTPQYVAPEIVAMGMPEFGNGEITGYDAAVDMWSLGVSLYFMLTGEFPFQSDERLDLYRSIANGSAGFPAHIWDQITPEAQQLVRQLLVVNPRHRLTAQQALHHPWITQNFTTPNLAKTNSFGQARPNHNTPNKGYQNKRSFMDLCNSEVNAFETDKENTTNRTKKPRTSAMHTDSAMDTIY